MDILSMVVELDERPIAERTQATFEHFALGISAVLPLDMAVEIVNGRIRVYTDRPVGDNNGYVSMVFHRDYYKIFVLGSKDNGLDLHGEGLNDAEPFSRFAVLNGALETVKARGAYLEF